MVACRGKFPVKDVLSVGGISTAKPEDFKPRLPEDVNQSAPIQPPALRLGSYGTKLDAVVQCIEGILASNPQDKVR